MGPYIGLGLLLVVIWILIAVQKSPKIMEEFPDAGDLSTGAMFKILWSSRRYRFGVIAQFFNVAAQVCTWTYIIVYVQEVLGGSLALGGFVLQISLILFLISRFVMTYVIGRIRATKALAALAVLAVLLCVYAMIAANSAE